MGIALIALIVAMAAAGWFLWRLTLPDSAQRDQKSVTLLKLVVLFALSAALFAAKLWPLAFMVLLAVVGVGAIEAMRGGGVNDFQETVSNEQQKPNELIGKRMTQNEALSILGLEAGANVEDVRSAHRKLIAQIHPDKGGTDYLAAKINEARDFLLQSLE